MDGRTAAAVITTGIMLIGGVGACSSDSGSTTPSPPATSAATPNGIQDQEPEEILSQTRAAAQSADSVRIKADTNQQGQAVGFDLVVTKNGAQGTFTTSQIGSVELVTTPEMIYIKGDETFNRNYGGEAGAKLLAGKWLGIPADHPDAASFSGFGDVESLMGNVLQTDATSFTKEGTRDIDGVPCIGIKGDRGTLFVATVGPPFPMSVEPPEGEEGRLTMAEWNEQVTITPPPNDEVIDVSQLPNSSASPTPSPTAS